MKMLTPSAADLVFLSNALKKLDFFSNMSMGELERALGLTRMIEMPADKKLMKEGDVGDAMYVIYEGRLRVVAKGFLFFPGRTLAHLGPGDIVGEMALLDQPYRTATVVTETPSKLFVLLIAGIAELFGKNESFLKAIGQLARLRRFQNSHSP